MLSASSATNATVSLPQLSGRAAAASSSAIRDLLDQAKRPGMISLAGGLPDAALFPVAELAAIATRVIAEDGTSVLQYGTTAGTPLVRSALSSRFDQSVDTDALVVTTGSQQALDLIAQVMLDPGDQVVVGDPDYLGALQVFRSYRSDLRPISIDADGLNTEQLEDELRWGLRPKLCYLVPHFHNPTGVTMSSERRAHLNELSAKYGFLVIEDDPYRELMYQGGTTAAAPSDPELTVQLRSTSKVLAPGLRVGALAGPRWLVDPLTIAKQSCDLHTSSVTQAIVAEALHAPWFQAHLAELRLRYRNKRDVIVQSLQSTFGDGVDFLVPHGGMFLWVDFKQVPDTTRWLAAALDHGVCFVPGSAFAVDRDLSSHARLSFSTASEAELIEAVKRLAASVPVKT